MTYWGSTALSRWSLSGRTSYRKTSWSIEATRFRFSLFQPLWKLIGISPAALPRWLSNSRAMRWLLSPIARLRGTSRDLEVRNTTTQSIEVRVQNIKFRYRSTLIFCSITNLAIGAVPADGLPSLVAIKYISTVLKNPVAFMYVSSTSRVKIKWSAPRYSHCVLIAYSMNAPLIRISTARNYSAI